MAMMCDSKREKEVSFLFLLSTTSFPFPQLTLRRHDMLMAAFGGKGFRATNLPELAAALEDAIHSALHDRVSEHLYVNIWVSFAESCAASCAAESFDGGGA